MLEKRRHDPSPPLTAARRVTELGLLARLVLESGNNGAVIAAFQRSFYAAIGRSLICVGARSLGSGPLHVLCDHWPDDPFNVGQMVTVDGAALCVDGLLLGRFDDAPVWQPDPAPVWSPASLTVGLQAAGALWRMTFGGEDLGPVAQPSSSRPSHLMAAARPAIDALTRVLDDGLRDGAPRSASFSADGAKVTGLIGLGPGLTPSGDDFLLGALVALAALGLSGARDALWDQCRPHLDRTNDISRAHLGAAALGYGAAALHAAIHATMAGRVAELKGALSAVSEIGQTSGRDGFAGALTVLQTVERHVAVAGRSR